MTTVHRIYYNVYRGDNKPLTNIMIKLYITAIETRPDGSAVTLFEDFHLGFQDLETLRDPIVTLNHKVADKIEEVELANEQATTPF